MYTLGYCKNYLIYDCLVAPCYGIKHNSEVEIGSECNSCAQFSDRTVANSCSLSRLCYIQSKRNLLRKTLGLATILAMQMYLYSHAKQNSDYWNLLCIINASFVTVSTSLSLSIRSRRSGALRAVDHYSASGFQCRICTQWGGFECWYIDERSDD